MGLPRFKVAVTWLTHLPLYLRPRARVIWKGSRYIRPSAASQVIGILRAGRARAAVLCHISVKQD